MKLTSWGPTGLLATTLVLAGCGGGGGGEGGISGTGVGTLRLALTDAPACGGYEEVNVTIQAIRVHHSATAADTDGGWSSITLSPARRVDLTNLTNGVLEELGETTLPAGKYTQLRLVLAENAGANPLANSVLPAVGGEAPLTTPSAQQSGLKLNVNIDVAADKRADFVLDFDACKSVVKRGASGHFNLKPVISVIPRLSDAGMRVIGYVSPAIATGDTAVSLQLNGVPVKSTPPNPTNGQFVLYPVPAGTYNLVVTATGRVTAVMTGVPVLTTEYTYVNSAGVPIAPAAAASAARIVDGSVTPSSASVRALQSFTGGPTVEVGWAPVDPDNGKFSFSLPVDAPVKTAYVRDPATLTFIANDKAGLYTIEASSAGSVKVQDIDVKVPVLPLVFSFP